VSCRCRRILNPGSAAHLSANNTSSPAYKLPPEIICVIFSQISFAKRLEVSATCRYWRDVLLSFSELWADPCLKATIYLPTFLNRSGSQPLSIKLRHDGGFRINLDAHARHIASVNVEFDFRANAARASELFTAPSYSILQELNLDHPGFPNLKPLALTFDAPNLRTVVLRGFGIPLTLCRKFTGLRELVLLGQGSQRVHSEAFEILANSPQLEVFLILIDNRGQLRSVYTGELLLVPRLRRLGIRLTDRGRANDLQLYAPLHPATTFSLEHSTWHVGQPLSIYRDVAFEEIYVTSRRVQLFDPTVDLHLRRSRSDETKDAKFEGSFKHGRLFELSASCAFHTLSSAIDSSMDTLRSLCIDTFAIRQGVNLIYPIFQVLEELSLRDAAHARFFDLKDLSGLGHFHCTMPALKTFRFIAPDWLDPSQQITGLRQRVDLQADRALLTLGRFIASQREMGMMMLERFVLCGIPYTLGRQETFEGPIGGRYTRELVWEDAGWTPDILKLDRWDEELVRG